MAMDPRTIAFHEAGHAVMQWFVGWEADLEFIQMRRVENGVVDSSMKIAKPDRTTYADERIARRKLLVLLAGAATTDDPKSQHNKTDFDEACIVLHFLFECDITWKPEMGVAVTQEKSNLFLQDANATCKAIVHHSVIWKGIEAVANKLLAAESDGTGVCRLYRDEIVEMCQRECGDIRNENPWSTWLTAG